VVSEVSPFRLALAESLGLATLNPRDADLVARVESDTNGAGADVVFEVTGTTAGAESMTKLPRTRGRIVVVAIYGDPPKVDLHRSFWRELRLSGARVCEREDFERAISLVAADSLPLDRIISAIYPLEDLEEGMRKLASGGDVMKVLVRCE
jgi:(R,R)-butanediol dehydrogenase / meso-butanediol dehydrogenase / diacetyl reductase